MADDSQNRDLVMQPMKYGIFTDVPEGKLVIYEGRFRHKLTQKNVGFHLSLPWTHKTIIITTTRTKDYSPESYKCKDNNMITVDISINYQVVNAERFYIQKNAGQILHNEIRGWVNASIGSHTLAQIQKNKINIYEDCKKEIEEFKDKYGVEVLKISLQRITYSDELQKMMEQKAAFETEIERGNVFTEILKNKLAMLFEMVPDLTTEDKKQIIQEAMRLEKDTDFSKIYGMAYAMSVANQAAAQSQNGKTK